MNERPRRPGQGDISGETHGDFTDWDNPEDHDEGAPEGYYDGDDDSYIPDKDDPDYDLSEVHGYSNWEPARAELIPRWVIVTASILLIVAILIPLLIRIN
jgi:hypothetical protein